MSNHRLFRFALVPVTALVLLAALVILTAGSPTPVAAAGTPDWQQMGHNMAMTDTMPMTSAMPAMMSQMMHQMQQMQAMLGQMTPMSGTMSMTGTLPMRQPGLGMHMEMMGRMMQMMGLMMQMTGMMHDLRAAGMPMTDTMPMEDGMQPDMMGMMQQMMGRMQGMMGGTLPMTTTAPMSDTSDATLPAQTQTAQVGAVEIKVTPTNLQETAADTLEFTVELNSHSAEIDLDLAETARLRVGDDELTPVAWETATPKGHHVSGVLRFARTADDDEAGLDEAAEIGLVIGGLPGAEEQTFTWQLAAQ
jgi:hypothetical protein